MKKNLAKKVFNTLDTLMKKFDVIVVGAGPARSLFS